MYSGKIAVPPGGGGIRKSKKEEVLECLLIQQKSIKINRKIHFTYA
jgi:hypothetical protein